MSPGKGSIYIYYLEFFCKEGLSLLSHVIQSFISVQIHISLSDTLDYNSLLCNLFCFSKCSSFGKFRQFFTGLKKSIFTVLQISKKKNELHISLHSHSELSKKFWDIVVP